MRSNILKCLGTFPNKVELRLNIIEEIDCGEYYRRLIEYSVEESIIKQKILHNFALYVPRLQEYCDMDEVIYQIAPRNILIMSGLKDERHFPLEGIEKIEIRNKNKENFKSIKFEEGHLFNDQEKEIAYKWLSECLS